MRRNSLGSAANQPKTSGKQLDAPNKHIKAEQVPLERTEEFIKSPFPGCMLVWRLVLALKRQWRDEAQTAEASKQVMFWPHIANRAIVGIMNLKPTFKRYW